MIFLDYLGLELIKKVSVQKNLIKNELLRQSWNWCFLFELFECKRMSVIPEKTLGWIKKEEWSLHGALLGKLTMNFQFSLFLSLIIQKGSFENKQLTGYFRDVTQLSNLLTIQQRASLFVVNKIYPLNFWTFIFLEWHFFLFLTTKRIIIVWNWKSVKKRKFNNDKIKQNNSLCESTWITIGGVRKSNN